MARWVKAMLACCCAVALAGGCAWLPGQEARDADEPKPEPSVAGTPWAEASSRSAHAAAWQHYRFPGKQPTQYNYTRMDGRDAMAVYALSSASMLRKQVRVEPADLQHLRFSWKVPELIAQADMAVRESDDCPVRIVLAFDGDRKRFSAKNAMMSELMRTLTGEEMPYATLMYVWSKERTPGSVIVNPRTDRIRKMVVESGGRQLGRWADYERDIRADYEKAFGEPPGALIGIGIMTDTDNTRTKARAWYGPVRLVPASQSTP